MRLIALSENLGVAIAPVTKAPQNTNDKRKTHDSLGRRLPKKHSRPNSNPLRGKDSPLSAAGAPYRWQKGKSGNPGGRPRNVISDAIRAVLAEEDPELRVTNAEVIARGLVEDAKGTGMSPAQRVEAGVDPRVALMASDMVLDRTEGKPAQSMILSGGENPIKVQMEEVRGKLFSKLG